MTVVLHLVHLLLLVALASSVCTVASVAMLFLAGTEPTRASAVFTSWRCWSTEGVGQVVLILLARCRCRRDFFRACAQSSLFCTVGCVLGEDGSQPALLCVQASHFGLQAGILNFHNLALGHQDCRLLLLLVSAFGCGHFVPLASSSSSIFVLRGEILQKVKLYGRTREFPIQTSNSLLMPRSGSKAAAPSSGSDFSFWRTFILRPSLMNCDWMCWTEF